MRCWWSLETRRLKELVKTENVAKIQQPKKRLTEKLGLLYVKVRSTMVIDFDRKKKLVL